MIKVNLVPAEILAKAEQKQQVLQATAAGVFALIVLALISFGHYYKLNKLEHQLQADNARLKQLQVIVDKVQELEKTAAAVRARLNVITDLLKGRPMYPYFMSDFARSVPSGIQIKTLSTTGGGSSASPLKLSMAAQARDNDDIAVWVKRMEGSGRFSAIELGPVNQAAGGYDFKITSTYTPQL